ncbi:hypothetical protein [Candidatus Korobacter versatilis]|nr:hypothetical protein [Candidatus Koribacter versatilis]
MTTSWRSRLASRVNTFCTAALWFVAGYFVGIVISAIATGRIPGVPR